MSWEEFSTRPMHGCKLGSGIPWWMSSEAHLLLGLCYAPIANTSWHLRSLAQCSHGQNALLWKLLQAGEATCVQVATVDSSTAKVKEECREVTTCS